MSPKATLAPRHTDDRLVRWLIFAMWGFGTIPPLLDAAQGRSELSVESDTATTSGVSTLVQYGFTGLVIAIALVMIVRAPFESRAHAPVSRLAIFLAPWAAAQLSTLFTDGQLGISIAYFPLVAIALWMTPLHLRVLSTAGALAAATAFFSVVAYFVAPALVTTGQGSGQDAKALVGDLLLAGPYLHSNTLGVAMALGFVSAAQIRRAFLRRASYVVIIAALLLSASRSSYLALAAVLLVVFLIKFAMRGGMSTWTRWAAFAVVATVLVAVVAIPLSTTTDDAWSNRGAIWISSLEYFQANPIFGQGPDFFATVAQYASDDYNQLAFHGHNLFVNTAVTVGVVGLVAVGLLVVTLIGRARSLTRGGEAFPLTFLVAYLVIGCLEVVSDFRNFGNFSAFLYVPMALILFNKALRGSADDVVRPRKHGTSRRRLREVHLEGGARLRPDVSAGSGRR